MSLFHSVFISYDWSLWSHDFLIQGRKLSFQVTCPFSLFCLSGSQADDFPCPNDNFFPSHTFRWPKFPALKLTGVSLDMSELKFFVIESFFFYLCELIFSCFGLPSEAELERFSTPEMFEKFGNSASNVNKTAKTKGKTQESKTKVCGTRLLCLYSCIFKSFYLNLYD